jgi:hypothetical protein
MNQESQKILPSISVQWQAVARRFQKNDEPQRCNAGALSSLPAQFGLVRGTKIDCSPCLTPRCEVDFASWVRPAKYRGTRIRERDRKLLPPLIGACCGRVHSMFIMTFSGAFPLQRGHKRMNVAPIPRRIKRGDDLITKDVTPQREEVDSLHSMKQGTLSGSSARSEEAGRNAL